MRLAIIGQQAFGQSVLEAFHTRGDDVAGVFCAPEKPGAKPDPLKVAAEKLGVKVFQLPSLKGAPAEEAMKSLNVEIGIMAFVLQFAPQGFVNIPKHGTIQYHPSLLPKYRGPSSINWPIIRGEKQTGLTIFRPTDGLDEGPIVLQKTTDIGPNDTLGSVYFDRLYPMGVAAMVEAADLVVAGRHKELVQDESQASYEGWAKDPEAVINWRAHVTDIHNLIRGCDPAPGAWAMFGDKKVRFYEAKKELARRFADVTGKIGEVTAIGPETLSINLQGGRLDIGKARIDGTKDKLSGAALASQLGLAAGSNVIAPAQPATATT